MDFYVIGDENMVLGLGLVGIPGEVVSSEEDTLRVINESMKKQIKIILISDRLLEPVRYKVEEIILKRDFPLLLEIPDRQGPVKGKKSIRDLLKSSLGFNI